MISTQCSELVDYKQRVSCWHLALILLLSLPKTDISLMQAVSWILYQTARKCHKWFSASFILQNESVFKNKDLTELKYSVSCAKKLAKPFQNKDFIHYCFSHTQKINQKLLPELMFFVCNIKNVSLNWIICMRIPVVWWCDYHCWCGGRCRRCRVARWSPVGLPRSGEWCWGAEGLQIPASERTISTVGLVQGSCLAPTPHTHKFWNVNTVST